MSISFTRMRIHVELIVLTFADMAATHRPGPLKQQNKSHKHGKHKSKSETKTDAKGGANVVL